jgi:hypothetical protein
MDVYLIFIQLQMSNNLKEGGRKREIEDMLEGEVVIARFISLMPGSPFPPHLAY